MRKWMTFLMALMVGASSYTYAFDTVGFEFGYRQDTVSLKHEFGDDLEIRNHFHDLDIFQIGAKAKGNLGCNFYGRAEGTWGWILDGKYRREFSVFGESDYSGSGSNSGVLELTKKSRDVADDRYVFDANVAIGYPFYFCDCTTEFAPVVGYAFDEQNLRLNRSEETFGFDSDSGYSGCGGCCDQKFISRWYGPFVGFDVAYRPCNECWSIFGEVEFHWTHYKGRTHINGNEYFTQRARNGHGWVVNVGAEYDFCNCWTAALAFKYTDFRVSRHRHGSSSSFFDSYGDNDGFNGANGHFKWRSVGVNLILGRGF